MHNILLISILSIVLVAGFLFGILKLFGGRLELTDALIAAFIACLLSLIPTYGPGISVIGILIVVYWRGSDISIPMVLVASFLARIFAGVIIYKLVAPAV
jgi:hypothetical protein